MLTTLALTYFPFPPSSAPIDPLLSAQKSAEHVTTASDKTSDDSRPPSPVGTRRDVVPESVGQFREHDYVAMDRSGPDFVRSEKYVVPAALRWS